MRRPAEVLVTMELCRSSPWRAKCLHTLHVASLLVRDRMPAVDRFSSWRAQQGRRLRIGIDARDLAVQERTGVERVVFHFIENLPRTDGCEFVLFVDRPLDDALRAHLNLDVAIEPVRFPRLQRLLDAWAVWQLRAVLRRNCIDVFFSPNTKFPLGSVPSYTTVHGAEWFFYPRGYRAAELVKQWVWFQLCTRWSAGIVTFTHNTRDDILRIRRRCNLRIRVVPEGVDPMFRRLLEQERSEAVLNRLGISAPFVLSVCSLVPRKNIDSLVRSFALLKRQYALPHSLVLVGRSGWKADRLKALSRKLGVGDAVCFAGYVPDADLVQLYSHASVFAYPSKYEGFGLPPLEAMRCGVPVVTSERSATAEIARDAAVLINPDSDEDLAGGLYQVLTDETLRQQLIEAGLERAQRFTWPAMAAEIIAFIVAGETMRHAAITRNSSGTNQAA